MVMGLDNPIHILFIVLILLLVFGARRLPEIGRSLGSGMREFKDSVSGNQAPSAQQAALTPPAQQAPVAQPAAAVPQPAPAAQPAQAPAQAPVAAPPTPVGAPAPAQAPPAPVEQQPQHQG